MLDQSYVKERLRAYICRHLLNNPSYNLTDEQSLINGGVLDSFAITDIVVFVDETFGVYIPNEELDVDKMDNLNSMVTQILLWDHNRV